MTEEQLQELERLEQAATPGPWDTGMLSMEICTSNSYTDWCRVGANERLAIAARNALPHLLAEVRRLRALRERLQKIEGLAHQAADHLDKAACWANDLDPHVVERLEDIGLVLPALRAALEETS